MGTNKQVEIVDDSVRGTPLRIKWSDGSPFDANQKTKLLMSLSLAGRVCRFAANTVRLMWPSPDLSLRKVHESILATHFKLRELGHHRNKIADGLDAIHLGLRGDLTIADAFSSTLVPLKAAADRYAAMELDILSEKKSKIEQKFISDADFGKYGERLDKHDLARAKAKGDYIKQRKEDWKKAINTAGFVKHRVAGAQDRTDPSAPQLLPQQKGSIHINFATLLASAQFRPMHVALTLIHEASHKFIDTFDFAYTYDPGYDSLTSAQALRNADSFAFAAVSIYLRQLVRTVGELYQH